MTKQESHDFRRESIKPYEYVEHTADMGLLVRGKNLSELLKNAAQRTL